MVVEATDFPNEGAAPDVIASPAIESAGAEDEGDLALAGNDVLGRAFITATDWTTETMLSQLRRGTIDLNPSFQRRDAWVQGNRKARFIESLFLGLPIPQLVLAEQKGSRNKFLVIDGKQRLLALRQFAAEPGDGFQPLVLTGLKARPDLNGFSLAALRNDDTRTADVIEFDNQAIRTVVVRNWQNEAFLYAVFLRLNTGTVPLAPQELRHALHPGPFVEYAEEFSLASQPVHRALGLSQPDFRMRDVELVVRFFAFSWFLADYGGDLKTFLDDTCRRLNHAWPTREADIRETSSQLEAAISTTFDVFGTNAFRRWSGDGAYERLFNRAVFDCMTYYFRFPKVASKAVGRASFVERAFKSLTERDDDFAQALISTTKSKSATDTRISKWGEALSKVIRMDLSSLAFRGFTLDPR